MLLLALKKIDQVISLTFFFCLIKSKSSLIKKYLIADNDIVIAISTSGRSKNVIEGIKTSKKLGATIISFTGDYDNEMRDYSDHIIKIPSNSTPRIQEGHRTIIHIICELVERNL